MMMVVVSADQLEIFFFFLDLWLLSVLKKQLLALHFYYLLYWNYETVCIQIISFIKSKWWWFFFYTVPKFLGFEFSGFSLPPWLIEFFGLSWQLRASHVTTAFMRGRKKKYLRLLKETRSLHLAVFYHLRLSKRLLFRHKLFHPMYVLSFQGQFMIMCW